MLLYISTACFVITWNSNVRLLCPWDFSNKDTGLGCHFLIQRIFLIESMGSIFRGLNPCLLCFLHWQVGFFFFFNHWATWIALRGSLQSVRGKSGWIYAPAFPSLYGIIMRYVLHSFSESQWCWAPIAYRDSLLTNAILILFSLLCATSFLLHLGFSRFLLNKLPRLSLTICFWRRPN